MRPPSWPFLAGALLLGCSGPVIGEPGMTNIDQPQVAQGPGSPPPAIVEGVERVHVVCLLTGSAGVALDRQAALCERLQRLASDGAPVPVSVVQIGDPALLDPAALVLLLHAMAEQVGDRPVLAFSLRPFRNAGARTAILFGPAPRAVPAGDEAQLTEALRGALDEVLPWRSPSRRPRRIN